jgi:hypothetical protein
MSARGGLWVDEPEKALDQLGPLLSLPILGGEMSHRHGSMAALAFMLLLSGYSLQEKLAGPANRVTILYDAFGKSPTMRKDWGYSALVEHGGKRILFDTGNNPAIFAQNVTAAQQLDLEGSWPCGRPIATSRRPPGTTSRTGRTPSLRAAGSCSRNTESQQQPT